MELNDFFKELFGSNESMSLTDLTAAASASEKAKFVDLKAGGYVDAEKYNSLSGKLAEANQTIQTLQDTAKNYEGVDVSSLNKQLEAERDGRARDKKEFALKSLLTQNGCKDIDYVLYKLGDTVEFDEKGEIKDAESFIKTTKETYASQFAKEPGATVLPVLSGVTPAQPGDPNQLQKTAPASLTGAIEAAVKAQQEGR